MLLLLSEFSGIEEMDMALGKGRFLSQLAYTAIDQGRCEMLSLFER